MARFPLARPSTSHEDLFVARYDALLRQARRLTSTPAEAEDVVQDAFIRFSVTRPDLDQIDNLDGYLYTVLRNLHLVRIRRAARSELTSLSVIDFDSAESALRARETGDALETREALHAACAYGCTRRLSSKAGSLFLLRFFHGAVPSEVARIAGIEVKSIDYWLTFARREAHLFIEAPERLSFLTRAQAGERHEVRQTSGVDVLDECRASIFSLEHARCWSDRELDVMYGKGRTAIAAEALAEIVTCRACLTRVCGRLGISPFDDRFPTDTLGHNQRGGMRARSKHDILRHGSRRTLEVREHTPRELCVAVNGLVLTKQPVTSDVTELTFTVSLNEPVTLVEVLSEQTECLAFLSKEPEPLGSAQRREWVELSNDRSVELVLTFSGPWPTVRAVYRDPTFRHVGEFQPEAEDEASAPAAVRRDTAVETPRRVWWWRPLIFATSLTLVCLLVFGPPAKVIAAAQQAGRALIDAIVRLLDWRDSRPSVLLPSRTLRFDARSMAPVEPSRALRTPAPARVARVVTPEELIDAEISALVTLHQVGADRGEQIDVVRRSQYVEVRGVLDAGDRLRAVAEALAPLPHVRMSVVDARAAEGHRSRSSVARPAPPDPDRLSFVDDSVEPPLWRLIDAYLRTWRSEPVANGDETARVRAVNAFIQELRSDANGAAATAWALRRLAERYPREAQDRLSDLSQQRLRGIEQDYIFSIRGHVGRLHRSLIAVTAADPNARERLLGTHGEPQRPEVHADSATAQMFIHTTTMERQLAQLVLPPEDPTAPRYNDTDVLTPLGRLLSLLTQLDLDLQDLQGFTEH